MRYTKHEQSRRQAMANCAVEIGREAADHELSDLEYVTVLSGLLNGMLNRMANTEIRGQDPDVE